MCCEVRWVMLGLCGASMVFSPAIAEAQDVDAAERLMALDYAVRDTLGYDLITMSALGVSPGQYGALVDSCLRQVIEEESQLKAIWQGTEAKRGESDPAAVAPAESRRAVSHPGVDRAALDTLTAAWQTAWRQDLNPAQIEALQRREANVGLDPLLALVHDLTQEQRQIIQKAMRQRDQVLSYPGNWHRKAVISAAHADYEAVLDSVLSPTQQRELAELYWAADENLKALGAEESVVFRAWQLHAAATGQNSDRKVSGAQMPTRPGTVPWRWVCQRIGAWLRSIPDLQVRGKVSVYQSPMSQGEPVSGLDAPAEKDGLELVLQAGG